MTNEEEKAINSMKAFICTDSMTCVSAQEMKTVLNLIQKQQEEIKEKEYLYKKALSDIVLADKELKKKDKIIDTAIKEVENLREYFSEDLQPDFIRILEILKDKKVIDW